MKNEIQGDPYFRGLPQFFDLDRYMFSRAGSWLALSRLNAPDENGNVFMGNVESTSTKRTIVKAGDKLVAVVGLEDVVVVDTEDATLICSAEHTADIKKLLEELRSKGREEYL